MREKIKMISILVLLGFYILLLPHSTVHAQAAALSVSPSLIHLDLSHDKPETEITYKNTTNQTLEISLTAQDFTELEDGYKLSFLEGKDAKNYKYRLSSWIDFNKKTLVISPLSSESVVVYINKNELTPGGHYASILANITSKNKAVNSVSIKNTLSSLLFVRTNTGREIESASISSFSLIQDGIFFSFPTGAFFRLQNMGDVEMIPYGSIKITDFFGRTIAKGIINIHSLSTLPDSIRRYDVPFLPLHGVILPGVYKATFSAHAGKKPFVFSFTQSFFSEGSLPLFQVLIVSLILIIIIIFIRNRKIKIELWKKK